MHPLHFTNAEQIWCSHENGTTNRMLWKRGFRTQHSSVLITQIMNYLVLSLVIPLLIIFVFHRSNVKVVDPLQDSGADNGPVVQGEFTPRTLYKHNGFDTETIYIAVKGKVFDVSRARQFYGPSGPYSNFAGHDASRGLALNSFEMDVITPIGEPIDTLDDLTEQDHKSLDGWEEMFQSKYPQVGTLVNE